METCSEFASFRQWIPGDEMHVKLPMLIPGSLKVVAGDYLRGRTEDFRMRFRCPALILVKGFTCLQVSIHYIHTKYVQSVMT